MREIKQVRERFKKGIDRDPVSGEIEYERGLARIVLRERSLVCKRERCRDKRALRRRGLDVVSQIDCNQKIRSRNIRMSKLVVMCLVS